MNNIYYDINEAAPMIHVHPESLRRMCRRRQINYGRVGKRYMFTQAQLDAYVAVNGSSAERRRETDRFERRLKAKRA